MAVAFMQPSGPIRTAKLSLSELHLSCETDIIQMRGPVAHGPGLHVHLSKKVECDKPHKS